MNEEKFILDKITLRSQSLAALAPQWLIIDAAACSEPVWFAQGVQAQMQTLFQEQDLRFSDAGPWLIDVIDNPDLITLCMKHDPLGHACLWVNSALPVNRLHHQLQQRLYAKTYDGTKTRFRFYDPRVLHLYLNDITPQRKLALLAPFSSIIYADINPFHTDQHWLSWQLTKTEASYHTIEIKES